MVLEIGVSDEESFGGAKVNKCLSIGISCACSIATCDSVFPDSPENFVEVTKNGYIVTFWGVVESLL